MEKKKKAREQHGSGKHTSSSTGTVDLAFMLLYELQTTVDTLGLWELETRTRRFDLNLLKILLKECQKDKARWAFTDH